MNIGSGVSLLKVDSETASERISGSSLGGGTFWGLCRLLTRVKNFDEMLELSMRGDNSKVTSSASAPSMCAPGAPARDVLSHWVSGECYSCYDGGPCAPIAFNHLELRGRAFTRASAGNIGHCWVLEPTLHHMLWLTVKSNTSFSDRQ